jgi:dihydropteroate synthase
LTIANQTIYICVIEMQDGKNNTSLEIACQHCTINFSTPHIMGIVNVTPDSFFDGGQFANSQQSIDHALNMIEQGATIIDVGGQSTKPNAAQISASEEIDRITNTIEGIRKQNKTICISVDTFYAKVAKEAIALGADMINDVSAGNMDAQMLPTIGQLQVPYMMMHMQGTPATMQAHPQYKNVVQDVATFFEHKIAECTAHQIKQIIIDPGFGFGKTIAHNYQLLQQLNTFATFNLPILVGLSRKSMIYKTLNTTAAAALNGTTALHMAALLQGANILRVHDVQAAKETITLFNTIKNA